MVVLPVALVLALCSGALAGTLWPTTMFTAVTTGTSQWVPVQGVNDLTFVVSGAGTTSGGTIVLEEADTPGPASTLYTVNASDVTAGGKKLVHVEIGAGQYVVARIGSNITGGGTVSVSVFGQ